MINVGIAGFIIINNFQRSVGLFNMSKRHWNKQEQKIRKELIEQFEKILNKYLPENLYGCLSKDIKKELKEKSK